MKSQTIPSKSSLTKAMHSVVPIGALFLAIVTTSCRTEPAAQSAATAFRTVPPVTGYPGPAPATPVIPVAPEPESLVATRDIGDPVIVTYDMGEPPVTTGKDVIPVGKDIYPIGKEITPVGRRVPFNLRFGLDNSVLYDSNIYLSEIDETSDWIWRITPRVYLEIGDAEFREDNFVSLRYAPQLNYYFENTSDTNWNQDVLAEFQYRLQRLTFTGFSSYQRYNDGNPFADELYQSDVYTNALRAAYNISPKTNIEVGAQNQAEEYGGDDELLDSSDWRFDVVGEYLVSDKTALGLGYAYGNLDVAQAPDIQQYHEIFGRVRWFPTGKLSVTARAGVDIRDIWTGQDINFIGDALIQYNPRPGTALALTLFREINPSEFFVDENSIDTGLGFKIEQELGRRFYAGGEIGFAHANYYPVTNDGPTGREDDYFYVRPWIGYSFREWISLELFYFYRESDSNIPGFSYVDHQAGATLSLDF